MVLMVVSTIRVELAVELVSMSLVTGTGRLPDSDTVSLSTYLSVRNSVGGGFPLEKDTVCVNLARGGDMMESTDCSDLGERSLISFSFLSPCTQLLVLLMVLVPVLVLLEIKLEL
jgi:hypothetical protein